MHALGLIASLLILSFTSGVVRVVVINDVEGYYWRDYYGDIPPDAVPGGIDKLGRKTYIGQVLHISPVNGKLIPGTIDAATRKMYYAWDAYAYEITKNVKILCSQHPEQFNWIETDIANAQILPQKNLVIGGYDTSYNLFIGKIFVAGEVIVGKVTLTSPYEAIGYAANGKPYFAKRSFKILSFNPDKFNGDSCVAANIVNITTYT